MTPSRIRLLDLGTVPAWQSQALYHAIAERMRPDRPDTIILCRPGSPHLCLGYHQVYDEVLDRQECKRRSLPVYRRRLGGGATYLDSDQIFYQCIFHYTRIPVFVDRIYAQMLAAPVKTLRRLGIPAGLVSTNEIVADGKRLAGVGGGRIGEASVVVGNLLLDFDYELMARVWRVPWEPFRELASWALGQHLTTLRANGIAASLGSIQQILEEEFSRALGRPLELGRVTPGERSQSERAALRLTSQEYLNLHASNGRGEPMQALKIAAGVYVHAEVAEMNGYRIQASLLSRDGIIRRAHLESIPAKSWIDPADRLTGVPIEDWKRCLSN
ncbi:MAG: biotin/lipoate A/B protein ligase family protein [Anaerolineales bacterium]